MKIQSLEDGKTEWLDVEGVTPSGSDYSNLTEQEAIEELYRMQQVALEEDYREIYRIFPIQPSEFDTTRKLAVGFYVPSQNFKNMPEMTAVFFEDNMGLVATTGPAHDAESESYAALFANAPKLMKTNGELIGILRLAESALQKAWDKEIKAMNLTPRMASQYSLNPRLCSNTILKGERHHHPTAATLATVRDAIIKHGAK